MTWEFDRHLRYDDLVSWLERVAAEHPSLVSLESYGRSHEGRPLLLVTVTDRDGGEHDTKPAHWVDANIHATELTGSVAACRLIHHLVEHRTDPRIARALSSRTFYVVPRVNPDGAEAALADQPRHLRSSTRPWPRTDPLPGLECCDIDADGKILQMRIADEHGAWMPHADDARLLIPVPADGDTGGRPRYRLLHEGRVRDFDGWTVPTPRPLEGLDLNRNFPAGWSTDVVGAGDHPLSEPEIDALIRAIVARPNICGAHAYHTSGGVQLRPSSTRPDRSLPPFDVWAWGEFGRHVTDVTGYPVHSVFEDFTWDPGEVMSGAADDWFYEHLGVFSWTTEFWDVVLAATGEKQSTTFWYTGPTDEQALAVLRWTDEYHPAGFQAWRPFDHPELGAVELGGWDAMTVWNNPPPALLANEVRGHAEVAIHQVLAAPQLEIVDVSCQSLGVDVAGSASWRIEAAVANTGWLSTDVSAWARKKALVCPVEATLEGADVLGGPARQEIGQLAGRASLRFTGGNDGTPDRALVAWTVLGEPGTDITVRVAHQRAGSDHLNVTLGQGQ